MDLTIYKYNRMKSYTISRLIYNYMLLKILHPIKYIKYLRYCISNLEKVTNYKYDLPVFKDFINCK